MKRTQDQHLSEASGDALTPQHPSGKPVSMWKRRSGLLVKTTIMLVGLLGVIIVASTITSTFAANHNLAGSATPSNSSGLWGNTVPSNTSANDGQAVELGMRFTASTDGTIYGIRFYKGNGNSGTHTGSLWNAAGQRLATSSFTNESQTGWQQVSFSKPVAIKANTTYVASYFAPSAHYPYTHNFFSKSHTVGALTASNGLYKYGGGFPTQGYLATNYWVDVLFVSQSSSQSTPVPTQTSIPTRTATTQPITPTPQPTASTAQATPTATAPTPSPTTASSPAGDCANFSACGFPDASNTGVPTGTTLKAESGNISIDDDNTVIDGVDLTGSLDIYANNVTIENSRITSSNWWGINLRAAYSGLKILHCTIIGVPGKGPDNGGEDYGVSNMGDGDLEVAYSNISEFGNELSMGNGNLHDNYVHDTQQFINLGHEYQHTDNIISDGANIAPLIIRHNTLINESPIDKGASASVGLFADDGPVQNTTVDNNWIAGGAYALYGGNTGSSNIKITNNIFSTQIFPNCGYYGPVAYWFPSGSGNIFSGNTFADGTPVTPGT
jgi:cell division septation protein DedD